MEEIWIIGVGQFGSIAFHRLSQTKKERHFVLVDPVAENLKRFKSPTTTLIDSDGVAYLDRYLQQDRSPDWIVPALPVHLAAEWLLSSLGKNQLIRIPLPAILATRVPNPAHGAEGNLYVSHADFRCPDDCDEPRDLCSITRHRRKQDMFELLGNLSIERFKALNIRSRQLGPGIGGYRPEQLFELMESVKHTKGPLLVSTACRCHGVVTGLARI